MARPWPDEASPSVIGPLSGAGTSIAFTVPTGVLVSLESIYAEVTVGTTAAKPLLTVRDQSGVVIARQRQAAEIDASTSGSATWAQGLTEEASFPSGGGPGARVSRTAAVAAQSINPNANTPLTFNIESWASPGMVNLATQATRITITTDGMYQVNGHFEWTSLAGDTDVRHTFLQPNPVIGTATPQQCAIYQQDALNFFVAASGLIGLTAGRFLTLTTVHRAGGARAAFGALACQWVGPLIT